MGRPLRQLVVVWGALVASACAGGADTAIVETSTPTSAATSSVAPVSAFAAFDEATVVVDSGPEPQRLSAWLAATGAQRQRGLMEVTDADLEGRAGMAFWFDRPTEGGFWMRNTRLPLTIAFVDGDGGIVTISQMVPCPDSEPDCPITRPTGTYRWALEVPTERWDDLGIDAATVLRLEAPGLTATGSS